MFRSAVASALRHLYRGKLHAGIAVFGLAVGLCSALLTALYIRSQYTFDHFVPGYRNLYLVTLSIDVTGRPSFGIRDTPAEVAAVLKERFPQVSSVTRLAAERVKLRAGTVERTTSIYSVDPDFFDTLPLAVVAGDPAAALARPDQLVLTQADSRTFFGDEPALGRRLEIQLQDGSWHIVEIGALLADIPPDRTQLDSRMFISGSTGWTRLAVMGRRTGPKHGLFSEVRTLVRLHAGASAQSMREGLKQVLPLIIERLRPPDAKGPDDGSGPGLKLLRIDRVNTSAQMNPGFAGRIAMAVILGLTVLAIASVNFVNLLTARASARAMEVGVRKLAGAGRSTLAMQFLSEAFAHVATAVLVAVALTELLLPYVNAFLGADADFSYWSEPALLGWMLLAAVTLGLLAGVWPALVLSGLRPINAMRGARLARGRGGLLRQTLVTLQFALLTGLILAAGVVYLQRHFAIQAALRFNADQMLILETKCSPPMLTGLRQLPGVRDLACGDSQLIGDGWGTTDGKTRDGRHVTVNLAWVDDHVLALYGVAPLAGRALSAADFDMAAHRNSTRYLINESAMRLLGFKSPAEALGPYPFTNGLQEIVGVLPDFSMGPVDQSVQPTLFYADPGNFSRIYVKLKGTDIPPTLAAIDKVWSTAGGTGWLNRYFYEERVQRMYQSMLRDARAFGIIALVAVSLALLGLLGLAAAVADQRTRETGIRKALGANTSDVMKLLLWQFGRPVIWANLIAWPVAAWALARWLDSFVYRIDLPWWLFPATLLATVLIALATVSVQALRVARARPIIALRHE